MPKVTLQDITSGYNSTTKINANNDTIETAFDNTLSRDGSAPNAMQTNLDLNSNRVINLGSPQAANDAARWADVTGAVNVTGLVVPSQSGNAGKFLGTDGNVASWSNPPPYIPRTAAELAAGVVPTNYSYFPGDIRRYGAVSGSGDCSPACTAALAANTHVVIPEGDWRFDTMVTVGIGKDRAVHLESGAVVTRYAAYSTDTTPIFWLAYSNATLTGTGPSSQIKSENRAPNGVVLIGASSMTASMGRNIERCRLANLLIRGSTNYGQTTGDPDACVKIINPQLDGYVSYFHFLNNLVLNAANYGLWLQGWANGILASNLHGYWLGNTTLAAKAMIFSQGALDNYISGVFHHFSPDTPTIRIENYDNTATFGGSLHVTSYSTFLGIGCEQGGSNAYALVANANCTAFKNYIQIVDNVTLGYDISSSFRNNNSLQITSDGAFLEDVRVADTLTVLGRTTVAQRVDTVTTVPYSASMNINAALGNVFVITATNNTPFTINNPTNSQVGQVITIQIRNASGGALGTLTWGSNFRAANTTQPANGTSRSRTFVYYGSEWVELAPGTDIPN
jgi:hypothetical protein